jgi:hypothetical protein
MTAKNNSIVSRVSASMSFTAALFCAAAFFSCSDSVFEPSSDLGTSILSAEDSSLVDFNKNFRAFDIYCRVYDAYSRIDSTTYSTPGHFLTSSYLRSGIWRNEEATTYLEFNGDSLRSILSDTLDSITGLRIQIKSVKSRKNTALPSFRIYLMNNPQADEIPDTIYDSIATQSVLYEDSTGLYLNIGKEKAASIAARIEIDTILIDTTKKDANGAKITSVDTLYKNISLKLESDILFTYYSAYYTAGRPTLKIFYSTNSGDTTVSDSCITIASYSDYRVTDTVGISSAELNTIAVTSPATSRYAVISFDMRPFWNQLSDTNTDMEYRNILRTVVHATIDSGLAFDTASHSLDVLCGLFLGRNALPDTSQMTHFKRIDTIGVPDSFRVDTCVISHANNLISNRTAADTTGYLYMLMKPAHSSANLYWHKPDSIRIRAAISNPW